MTCSTLGCKNGKILGFLEIYDCPECSKSSNTDGTFPESAQYVARSYRFHKRTHNSKNDNFAIAYGEGYERIQVNHNRGCFCTDLRFMGHSITITVKATKPFVIPDHEGKPVSIFQHLVEYSGSLFYFNRTTKWHTRFIPSLPAPGMFEINSQYELTTVKCENAHKTWWVFTRRKSMSKREFVQLAHKLDLKKHNISGRFVSEKLDGLRFLWDGGVSRGIATIEVPFANVQKSNQVPIATGMWSRYGNAIRCPYPIADCLPRFPVEGELWVGRGQFQQTSSIVRSTVNPKQWDDVKIIIFDMPSPELMFADGVINNINYQKTFKGVLNWYLSKGGRVPLSKDAMFQTRYSYLQKCVPRIGPVELHQQYQLPLNHEKATEALRVFSEDVLDQGGEGVILKSGLWTPDRSYQMLKWKPWNDAEGIVTGYTWGIGKLEGLMGSLILCDPKGHSFKLSGFTDAERTLTGVGSPGEVASNDVENPMFPRGSIVTYKYRELTDDGIPKEARYWRRITG